MSIKWLLILGISQKKVEDYTSKKKMERNLIAKSNHQLYKLNENCCKAIWKRNYSKLYCEDIKYIN